MDEHTQKRGRKCAVDVRSIRPLGLPAVLMTVRVPRRAGEKHIYRALNSCAEALDTAHIRGLLAHRSFGYADVFYSRGFASPGCGALLRLKSADIVAAASAGSRCVLLSSRSAGSGAQRTFRALAGAFRHIVLDMPGDEAERLADLAWDLGLTPQLLGRDRTADADAAIFLTAPPSPVFLPSRCVYISPDGPGAGILGGREIGRVRFNLPERLRATLPEGFDAPALLSEALERGVLSPEEVLVEQKI